MKISLCNANRPEFRHAHTFYSSFQMLGTHEILLYCNAQRFKLCHKGFSGVWSFQFFQRESDDIF